MFTNEIAQCLVHSKRGEREEGQGLRGRGWGRRQLLLSLIRTKQGHASHGQGSQDPKQRDSLQAHFAGLALTMAQWSRKLRELDHKRASAAAADAKSLQSCPTLCDPTDTSPTDSSIPGILQARILDSRLGQPQGCRFHFRGRAWADSPNSLSFPPSSLL